MRSEFCEVCGNYNGECNPEAHAMEMRAHYYEMFEPRDRDDYDDGPEYYYRAEPCDKCKVEVDEDELRAVPEVGVTEQWLCAKCYDAWLQEPVGAGR